jgi:hypothetical protein
MAHRLATWLAWTVAAIATIALVVWSLNRREHEIQRFTGNRVAAYVQINGVRDETAIVIRTGSGAYVVKAAANEYHVERMAKGWQVGVWLLAGPRESRTPGPPPRALVFPPDGRTGDWKPGLVVNADLNGDPTRLAFDLMGGRRIRIDLDGPETKA